MSETNTLTVPALIDALKSEDTELSKGLMAEILARPALLPVSIARIRVILGIAGEYFAAMPQTVAQPITAQSQRLPPPSRSVNAVKHVLPPRRAPVI